MATLGDLKARIADELLKRNLTAQISAHISRAIEFYAGRRWWFNTGRMTGAVVSGSEYSPLPTGTRLIDTVIVGSIILERRDSSDIEEWETLAVSTGQPTDYTVEGSNLRLYPRPDAAYGLVINGTFDLPALATDGDSNAWTNDAQDLIAARARMTLCRDVLRDPDGAALAASAVNEAETDLQMKTIRRLGTGRVRAYI